MTKICCFTGHRNISRSKFNVTLSNLEELLTKLITEEGYTFFRAGGAMGFDTLAAMCVLKLKHKYPQIKLDLILPCRDQAKYFPPRDRAEYDYILKNADSIVYTQERYTTTSMLTRNRALVNGSDLCIAYMTHLSGGTFQTVNIARKSGVEVINIAQNKK